MTYINQLSSVTEIGAGDSLVVYSAANGDSRRISMTQLLAYIAAQPSVNSLVTQYSSPNAPGFNVTINAGNTFLLLTPTGTLATGTITLPPSPTDGQSVLVTSTQTVTALTIAGNGKTVNGAPTTITVSTPFRLRYDAVNSSWYRSAA